MVSLYGHVERVTCCANAALHFCIKHSVKPFAFREIFRSLRGGRSSRFVERELRKSCNMLIYKKKMWYRKTVLESRKRIFDPNIFLVHNQRITWRISLKGHSCDAAIMHSFVTRYFHKDTKSSGRIHTKIRFYGCNCSGGLGISVW